MSAEEVQRGDMRCCVPYIRAGRACRAAPAKRLPQPRIAAFETGGEYGTQRSVAGRWVASPVHSVLPRTRWPALSITHISEHGQIMGDRSLLRMPQSTRARSRPWLPEHDEYIRANWSSRRLSEIADHLGRDVPLTSKRAKMLGLPRKSRPLWSREEDEVLRRFYRTHPTKWVAKRLNRTVPQCVRRAGALGLRHHRRGAAAHRG